jgi:hypothetical protein
MEAQPGADNLSGDKHGQPEHRQPPHDERQDLECLAPATEDIE